MAKYKITGIPDTLPQAQNGGSFWKKRYNVAKSKKLRRPNGNKPRLSSRNTPNEVEEVIPQNQPMVEVQNIEQPSYWNQMKSEAEQGKKCPPGLYDYEGTGECVTESEYVARIKAQMEEDQRKFESDRAAKKQKFESDIAQLREDARLERQRQFDEDDKRYLQNYLKSKKSDKIEPRHRLWSNDYDKMVDVVDAEGNVIIDKKTGKPKQQKLIETLKGEFLVNKTKDGYYNLYPKNIVADRIYKKGFTEDQFKNVWGLDPKQVKDQMGDYINNAGAIYDQRLQDRIIKTAIDQNMTVEDAIKTIPKSEGTQTGLTNRFKKSTQKIIDDTFEEIQKSMLEGIEYNPDLAKKDEDVFYSDDPKTAWENKYHKNDLKYLSDKYKKGQTAYDKWMSDFGKIGQSNDFEPIEINGQTYVNPRRYDDRMADLRRGLSQGQFAITSTRANAARQGAQDEDFNKAFGEYMSNTAAPIQKDIYNKALEKIKNDPKAKINFLRNLEKHPDLVMNDLLLQKDDSTGLTYQELYGDRVNDLYNNSLKARQNKIKQTNNTYDIDDNPLDKFLDVVSHPFDAFHYWMSPREEMWDLKGMTYRDRLATEKEKGINLGTMDNPIMSVLNFTPVQALNPFKVGTNLGRAYSKDDFIGGLGNELVDIGTSVGFAKGLNALSGSNLGLLKGAGTLLSSTFNPLTDIGYALKAGKNFDTAIDEFKKGNYEDAGWSTLEGGLNAIPLIGLPKYLKGFKKADDATSGFNFNRTFNNTNQLNYNAPKLLGTQQIPKYNILNKDNQLIRTQYKIGGSLPKAQFGRIISGLKALKPISKPVSKPVKSLITAAEVNKLAPIIRANMPGMQARLSAASSLKDLGYVGKEFTGADMFRAAKSNESMNKLMQLAIDHDRTGYRQVSGEFIPTGGLLGGYGNGRKYNMYEQHYGRPMSQVEHMRLSGVDLDDPISLGAYQASTIPFEQYGYRAGIDDVNKGDALYLASLPEKYNRSYGPYQFKVTMPTDYSTGDWSTWYVKNIMGKKPYKLQEPYPIHTTPGGYNIPITRATPEPGEVLFDLGQSQGKGKDLFGSNNILTGSGLQTRRWVGTYGTQVGKVDPSFKFTNLLNMSASDYKEMEDLRNSIIKGYNTGWRGQYQKGGMTMNLSKAEIDKYVKDGYIVEEE